MPLTALLLIIASYLVGAIPFGLLLSLGSGVNIRQQGSQNIGATNVTRLLGRKLGVLTLLADVAKGFLPIFIAGRILAGGPEANLAIGLCGAATVAGHMFPVYLGFKGGKGVATGLGVFLYLAPLAVVLCLAVFVVAVRLSGFVSLGSLLGSAAMIPGLFLLAEPPWKLWLAAGVVVMIWIRHYRNIGRLLSGTEKSWKKKPGRTR
ncbi:glycerol-3-phosphate acyltransferase [bacterium BMS3Bbin14]|nr:glycerol-3-phosphate acyltransferase [bacterium BMS3Abin13]GBE53392.1 glycerol-3-phosphate acyltransferase [bacterium BMS3Bbin14]HDK43319.1 glycerol-3-phosphate 1-O-acyltransferase [Desulfobacteraceae bacterium]HDO30005.1 glycerol-3-phosphate 1-O-acyltransferase [Desulfobacteraceae bacterium]